MIKKIIDRLDINEKMTGGFIYFNESYKNIVIPNVYELSFLNIYPTRRAAIQNMQI